MLAGTGFSKRGSSYRWRSYELSVVVSETAAYVNIHLQKFRGAL